MRCPTKMKEDLIMPCHCWFDPGEESERLIKLHCQQIVQEIKRLEKIGDPIGISLEHTIILLTHLYTGECDEKDRNK